MTSLVHRRLLHVLGSATAADDVTAYFREPSANGLGFTGRLFEQFGGSENARDTDAFHAVDLLAVEALSVQVPVEAAFALLHGGLATQIAELLRQIPTDVDLGSRQAAPHVEGGAPADRAWKLIEHETGIGWVTAGKLMARKRPRLLPVYDQVVRCVLGAPRSAWLEMHEALLETDVHDLVNELRVDAPPEVSPLRVVDVAIWMRHHRDHAGGRCGEFGPAS